MGKDAIQHCRSYALEAERKMGQMLRETERAKGAKGNPGGRGASIVQSPDVTAQPTLAELGLSKRESAEAQKLAALPQASFEMVKAGEISRSKAQPAHTIDLWRVLIPAEGEQCGPQKDGRPDGHKANHEADRHTTWTR